MVEGSNAIADKSQELYYKTTFDAAVRYSTNLEELEVNLEYDSIALLLHITAKPAFRDRMHTLYLYTPDINADENIQGPRWIGDAQEHLLNETLAAFRSSSEAVFLLSRCFQNLDNAKNLQRIELCSQDGHSLVLEALRHAQFSRELAYLQVEPSRLTRVGYGCLSSTPHVFASFIKGLQIQPYLSDENHSSHNMSSEERETNIHGGHIKDYKPTTPEFKRLIRDLAGVESLELNGCRSSSELRLCHGCEDLFANSFAPVSMRNLTTLTINSVFISGGRLRSFIKGHAATLQAIDIGFTSLTDGSWRSVAQGMAKLPHLSTLNLTSIRQRRSANPRAIKYARPANFAATDEVRYKEPSHVQHFLSVFVACFSTVLCTNPSRFSWSRPKYFEARLFQLPAIALPSGQLEALL